MDRRFPIKPFEARLFQPFFGNSADLLQAELLAGGACNSNYLARLPDGQKFVCRIHSRGDPLIEKYVTGIVKDIVPAPQYLWVGDGVSVVAHVEGEPFKPTPALVKEAGRLIGRLSKISFHRSGELFTDGKIKAFEGWTSFFGGLTRLLQHSGVREYLNASMRANLGKLLTDQRGILNDFDSCHNLVHGDFNPDNMLVSGDAIAAVLDWEFAHSGCSYMDVGNFMRHLPSNWENDLAAGLVQEDFDLPKDWRCRASLMDLSNQLDFLTSARSHEFKMTCVERIQSVIRESIGVESIPVSSKT